MTRPKKSKEYWLNNTIPFYKAGEVEKPCHSCNFCPYGELVEAFPIPKKRTERSCIVFGHECPVYYLSEELSELNN